MTALLPTIHGVWEGESIFLKMPEGVKEGRLGIGNRLRKGEVRKKN